ncbi:MAG: hypothetical protein IKM63_05490 [Firmicutes bacterium]|nr:hypothetical protein [Bacillota bacterium]MBR6799509.1 hypothetical protein [Bacillota bacterium]
MKAGGYTLGLRNYSSSKRTVSSYVRGLEVYKRTGFVTTGTVDSRIASMQNIADACLSYKIADGDPKTTAVSETTTISGGSGYTTAAVSTSGYRNICVAGFDMDKESGSYIHNAKPSAVYTSQFRVGNLNSDSIKLTLRTWVLQEKIKSVGTRTSPTYPSYATTGQKRLAALQALSTKNSNFFKYSHCKKVVKTYDSNITVTNLTLASKELSVSGHDRIVCPMGWRSYNGDNGLANTFVNPKAIRFLSYGTNTSATIYYQFTGGKYQSTNKYPTKCSVVRPAGNGASFNKTLAIIRIKC